MSSLKKGRRKLCHEKLNSHAIVLTIQLLYNKRERSVFYGYTEYVQ